MITTDIAIIGAGPVALFSIFEAGLLKLRCHLIDYLPQVGGQLSEIYPKKPIYDIPGYPTILAQELIDNLVKQAEPFKPTYTLGERIESLQKIRRISSHWGSSERNHRSHRNHSIFSRQAFLFSEWIAR